MVEYEQEEVALISGHVAPKEPVFTRTDLSELSGFVEAVYQCVVAVKQADRTRFYVVSPGAVWGSDMVRENRFAGCTYFTVRTDIDGRLPAVLEERTLGRQVAQVWVQPEQDLAANGVAVDEAMRAIGRAKRNAVRSLHGAPYGLAQLRAGMAERLGDRYEISDIVNPPL